MFARHGSLAELPEGLVVEAEVVEHVLRLDEHGQRGGVHPAVLLAAQARPAAAAAAGRPLLLRGRRELQGGSGS